MRPPQRSLRRVSAPALLALQAILLASCDSRGPLEPKLGADAAASTMLNQYHYAKTVTITLPDSTLVPGRKVQATAEVRDQDGLVVSWAPVTWSAGDSEIVSISSDGLITGGDKIGTTTISAFSDGVTATRTLSVDPPWDDTETRSDEPAAEEKDSTASPGVAVHMVSITANATTLKVGESTQISGVVRDINGTPIPDVPIS